jgi:hypothetical protein
MISRSKTSYALIIAVIVTLLAGYWLLPLQGNIIITTDAGQSAVGVLPQIRLSQPAAKPGESLILTLSDATPWQHVKLYVAENEAQLLDFGGSKDSWVWRWRFTVPNKPTYPATFYHSCTTGCIEGGKFELGKRPGVPPTPAPPPQPTKLGVVFPSPTRDWHGRAGWGVDLLYVRQPEKSDFGIDTLARRVFLAKEQSLRVLVRIAYDRGQALPPTGDDAALQEYLAMCARLARDARYKDVYGFIIGSGYNRKSENSLAPDKMVTPEWYARLFNGYGLPHSQTDNVVQTMRLENPTVRVLVGPVSPWATDQTGSIKDRTDAPWLHYMNTLTRHIDEEARAKAAEGFALAAPDGFAVEAAGRPESRLPGTNAADEPAQNNLLSQWGDSQAGFRVYRDWIRNINRFSSTRNLPVYITATNTFTSDTQINPEQNYPAGWLTTALGEINREQQVQALCWFVDYPYDKWAGFSLQAGVGSLREAATEFDRLLKTP